MSKSSNENASHTHSHDHDHSHGFDPTNMTVEEIVEQSLMLLKEAGFKITNKRREIIEIFAENQNYQTAKFVYQTLSKKYPTMSYNTTYRNLYDFVERGILESTEYNQEQLFRISCGTHHHHHFICTECGKTLPIHLCPMGAVESELKDVEIEEHRFEVFGKCSQCK